MATAPTTAVVAVAAAMVVVEVVTAVATADVAVAAGSPLSPLVSHPRVDRDLLF